MGFQTKSTAIPDLLISEFLMISKVSNFSEGSEVSDFSEIRDTGELAEFSVCRKMLFMGYYCLQAVDQNSFDGVQQKHDGAGLM